MRNWVSTTNCDFLSQRKSCLNIKQTFRDYIYFGGYFPVFGTHQSDIATIKCKLNTTNMLIRVEHVSIPKGEAVGSFITNNSISLLLVKRASLIANSVKLVTLCMIIFIQIKRKMYPSILYSILQKYIRILSADFSLCWGNEKKILFQTFFWLDSRRRCTISDANET